MKRPASRVASVMSRRPARWCAPSARAEGGHGAGSGSGVGGGVVFAVDGVAEPVQRLHAPVVVDETGRLVGAGAVGGEVGDPECGDRGQWGAGGVGGVAFDQPDLVDVEEGQVLGCGGGPGWCGW